MTTVPRPAGQSSPPRGLLRASSEDLVPDILSFQRVAFPTRREDWVEPRWRWMFQASAARLGVEPMVWIYCSKGRVLAHQGAIAVRLHTHAGDCTTGWFVETMVLEEARGKAVGPMLVAKALQDLPFNLSLGQTEQMRELQYRLGWKQIAPLETLMFVLGGAVLNGKVPAGTGLLAGVWLTARYRARHWKARRPAAGIEVREVARFGDTHDALWQRVRRSYPVAVARDASYLNWKYVDQPGQSFVRLEIVQDTNVQAVAVLRFSEPDAVYRYRRAWLTDLVVASDDDRMVWSTLEAARQASRARHADALLFEIVNPALVQQALAFGFTRKEPARFLLVATEDPPSAPARLALDGANWLVTQGDSDIDRPW